jgi:transcriptional regulator with XRE-family HTH domain
MPNREFVRRPEMNHMTATPSNDQPRSITEKLQFLLQLRRHPNGHLLSAREVAAATVGPAQPTPSISSRVGPAQPAPLVSSSQVNQLISGRKTNPTTLTLMALAQAFNVPAPYLLPNWDDLTALCVIEKDPQAREVVRLLDGLEREDITAAIQYLREKREARGLPLDVAEEPTPPAGVDRPRTGRPRRRLSFDEAADRAADDLEGR